MKKNTFILLLLLITHLLPAQYQRVKMWEDKIAELNKKNQEEGILKDCVLLIGSSTFTRWDNAGEYFPESKIANRAFGGSKLCDQIYFFDQIIKPFNPKQVVIYAGDNDLNETSTTPEQFMEDVVCITRLIHYNFPDTKIMFLSIKPSPARTLSFKNYKKANRLMERYCALYEYVDYVNIWSRFFNTKGNLIKEYFTEDGIHITNESYSLLKKAMHDKIIRNEL